MQVPLDMNVVSESELVPIFDELCQGSDFITASIDWRLWKSRRLEGLWEAIQMSGKNGAKITHKCLDGQSNPVS